MNNTIWIFGDSFSWDHKIRKVPHKEDDGSYQYIQKYLNGIPYDCWGELVSKELGYNYVNHAAYQTGIEIPNLPKGNSNNCNINLINELSSEFKQGDIVFFGFTDVSRFEFSNENGCVQSHCSSEGMHKSVKDIIEKILLERYQNDFYIYDTIQKLKSIETLSEKIGFDLWYWDWSGCFDDFVFNKKIPNDRWIFFKSMENYTTYLNMICETFKKGGIDWETKNDITDSHMGKEGNKIHAEVLINYLKK